MEKKSILAILDKYQNGLCTETEKAAIEAWYNAEALKVNKTPIEEDLGAEKSFIWNHIEAAQPPIRIFKFNFKKIAAAAAIIIIAGAGLFYFNTTKDTGKEIHQIAKNDIPPGGNKAVLTLANGKKISLTDAANGGIAKQSGITITKTADGKITYVAGHSNHSPSANEYNTIETPKGGQYQITLPDGTEVWLNASSSLKYPASFASLTERKVELTGEGYFQVAKDKAHPFIVKTDKQEVEVLGTHFNVSAYADEPTIKTTLLEGSVKIVQSSGKQTIIKPDEQSVLIGDKLSVIKADIEETVAWKNGYFRFNDEGIESIMRKLSRWYDVDLIYEGAISSEEYSGKISQYKNISQVLEMLSSTKTVQFKVEGRRITIRRI